MFGIIYIIKNDINSKVYIGQTSRSLEERWKEHLRSKCNKNEKHMLIKRAIFKYGKEHFTISILEKCDISKLDEREIYYIKFYDSYFKGYNMTKGGQEGTKPLKLLNIEKEIISLYKDGFSLREIAKDYNVDKYTIKHILEINNINIRKVRTYKYTRGDRINILKDLNTLSRKEVILKYNISASYLSQLINGQRRI